MITKKRSVFHTLQEMGACNDALNWVKSRPKSRKTWKAIWEDCKNPIWLWWALLHSGVESAELSGLIGALWMLMSAYESSITLDCDAKHVLHALREKEEFKLRILPVLTGEYRGRTTFEDWGKPGWGDIAMEEGVLNAIFCAVWSMGYVFRAHLPNRGWFVGAEEIHKQCCDLIRMMVKRPTLPT